MADISPDVLENTKGFQDPQVSSSTITFVEGSYSGNLGHENVCQDDVFVVDWDGPEDQLNPKNWSNRRKWAVTIVVSCFTFIGPVSSSMMAPACKQVAQQYGITNSVLIAMMVSIFVLAYALGPFVLAPLSEIYGRSRVLQIANLWYLVWNLVCGFARNETQMIVFRFMAGLGGSAPLTIGGAVVGDCWRPEERGRAFAIYSLAPLLGPVVGPVAGAWIAEKSTWQWVFWSTSIVDAIVQIFGIIFLEETFAPVLLERKANKILKGMGTEKWFPKRIRTIYQDRDWQTIVFKSLTRPFAFFAREPIVQLLGIYMAFVYGLLYVFLTTMPLMFQGVYHQSLGIAGLHYIALGVGLCSMSQLNARLLDSTYLFLKNRYGGVGQPEFRLPSMVPGTLFLPIGLLLAGWGTENRYHWIVTDIGITFIGAATILTLQGTMTYVVDAFAFHSASALAAVSCLRSLAGFSFPLFAPAMYKTLGFGKGNTVLAVVAIVVGCPAPWLFWHFGERIRNNSKYARG